MIRKGLKEYQRQSLFLLLILLVSVRPSAPFQVPLVVVSIIPSPGATNVDPQTTIIATFNYPLVPASVTPSTFLVQQIQGFVTLPVFGIITVFGSTATFRPLTPLQEETPYQIVLKGGEGGITSLLGVMLSDFVSTFRTGRRSTGVTVDYTQGATVTGPRTGASVEIPGYTLKQNARVSIEVDPAVLSTTKEDSRRENSHVSLPKSRSGVAGSPSDDPFPSVSGFVRVTRVVRYQVDPPGLTAFGPGLKISLPVLPDHVGRLRPGAALRLFQLARRTDGQPVFIDTGIPAVIGTTGLFGPTVAISPDVQTFGTYAAFLAVADQATEAVTATAQVDQQSQLIFPVVEQRGGRASRLSFANEDATQPVTVELVSYTPMGDLFGTTSRTVPAGRGATFLVSDLFPGFSTGAIVARARAGRIRGQIEIADDFSQPGVLAVGEAIVTVPSALVFPVITTFTSRFTEIHLFNPFDEPVSIIIRAFDRQQRVIEITNAAGGRVTVLELPPHGKVVAACSGAGCERRAQAPDVVLPLDRLDGGYVLVSSVDASKGVVGAELFGDSAAGRKTLTMVGAVPLPRGCLIRGATNEGCEVSENPADPSFVPDAARQHTLYAPHFEDPPATADIVLVNVGTKDARAALSAFREDGSFRAGYPASGFLTLKAHQVAQLSIQQLLGFSPAPGYVRVEDPDSALVGVLINQRTSSPVYLSVIPLIADDPRIAQANSVLFLSRVQLDSAATIPRLTTGLVVFNPNNNANTFAAIVRTVDGQVNRLDQSVVKRGAMIRWRNSLSVSYPTVREGILQISSTGPVIPGEARRLIVIGTYRATTQSGPSPTLSTSVIAH